MELTWEALTLTSTFLDKEEVFYLRQVCKYWNRILTPVLCHTLIYDPRAKNKEDHKAFLKKYGVCANKLVFGFMGLGNAFSLTETEIEFLASPFPKLTALEFNICVDNPEKSALSLLEFSSSLPKLKHLELRGVIDPPILKLLRPLLSKLQVVSLGKIVHRDGTINDYVDGNMDGYADDNIASNMYGYISDQKDNLTSLLPYLELPLAKELRFFDERYNGIYDLLAQKHTSLECLFYCWNDKPMDSRNLNHNKSWMLIDMKKSVISHIRLPLSYYIHATIEFDVEQFEHKLHCMGKNSLLQQFKDIKNFFNDKAKAKHRVPLPPIKSFYLEFQSFSGDIHKYLQRCTDAPNIFIEYQDSYDSFEIPKIQHSGRHLVIKNCKGLAAFLWASKSFPKLTDFYFDDFIQEGEIDNIAFKFQSLVRFYTNNVQPASFWTRLIASSKELKQIMLAREDPRFDQLKKEYPKLVFGFWSTKSQEQKEMIGSFDRSKYTFFDTWL